MPKRPLSNDHYSPPLLEFCVRGPPVTAQVKTPRRRERLKAWKERVVEAARWHMADRSPVEGDLDVHLVEFSDVPRADRDNIAKPILDALQGIAYVNDRQVHLTSEWCNINGRYEVRFMSSPVARAMIEGHEFVWMRIWTHRPRQALR